MVCSSLYCGSRFIILIKYSHLKTPKSSTIRQHHLNGLHHISTLVSHWQNISLTSRFRITSCIPVRNPVLSQLQKSLKQAENEPWIFWCWPRMTDRFLGFCAIWRINVTWTHDFLNILAAVVYLQDTFFLFLWLILVTDKETSLCCYSFVLLMGTLKSEQNT